MALLDRLQHVSGFDSISNHTWSAAIYFLARGEVTRATVIATFNIPVEDESTLDMYKTYYDTLPSSEQAQFHDRVEAAGMLLEDGVIDQAKYLSFFT
jgi:hypothetical protein